jgi:hypothetical protein
VVAAGKNAAWITEWTAPGSRQRLAHVTESRRITTNVSILPGTTLAGALGSTVFTVAHLGGLTAIPTEHPASAHLVSRDGTFVGSTATVAVVATLTCRGSCVKLAIVNENGEVIRHVTGYRFQTPPGYGVGVGNSLFMIGNLPGGDPAIFRLDVRSGRVAVVPGTRGAAAPLATNGHVLLAMRAPRVIEVDPSNLRIRELITIRYHVNVLIPTAWAQGRCLRCASHR